MHTPLDNSIPDAELMAELRDLLGECPFLAPQSSEAVRRALRTLRGIEADVFALDAVLEALTVEGEILA